MTEVEQEQPGTTASRGEAAESRWRKLFASTGAPLAWGLVRYMVCGLVLGGALGAALPEFRGALLAALTGAVVAASGSGGPSGVSRRVALISAGAALVLTVVAFATGNDPVWAALAMGAVAILTSLAAAAGPLGALLGFLGSLAYFLVATMARVANLYDLVSLEWAAAHIAVGCLGGLIVVFVGTAFRRRNVIYVITPFALAKQGTYGALGVAAALLFGLFLISRLVVASAVMNATLWERQRRAA
jgi:hypothetical protein